jgi:hypothetical protein
VGPAEYRRLLELARAAGFSAVVDLSDTFDGRDPATLAIHPSDFHPNAEGHALLARRIAGALWPLPALEPLRRPAPAAAPVERSAIGPEAPATGGVVVRPVPSGRGPDEPSARSVGSGSVGSTAGLPHFTRSARWLSDAPDSDRPETAGRAAWRPRTGPLSVTSRAHERRAVDAIRRSPSACRPSGPPDRPPGGAAPRWHDRSA